MSKLKVGIAMCGSYCTFDKVINAIERLCNVYDVTPIMSENSASTDTRFGNAEYFKGRFEELTGKKIIDSIAKAEPIGPKRLLDVLVIMPCTGNTIAKIANGITDSSVTIAAKAHMRNERPVIIAVSTNDALAGNAKNIGELMARKNVYFVPFYQDDPLGKTTSLVADFDKVEETVAEALKGKQLQPLLAVKP